MDPWVVFIFEPLYIFYIYCNSLSLWTNAILAVHRARTKRACFVGSWALFIFLLMRCHGLLFRQFIISDLAIRCVIYQWVYFRIYFFMFVQSCIQICYDLWQKTGVFLWQEQSKLDRVVFFVCVFRGWGGIGAVLCVLFVLFNIYKWLHMENSIFSGQQCANGE